MDRFLILSVNDDFRSASFQAPFHVLHQPHSCSVQSEAQEFLFSLRWNAIILEKSYLLVQGVYTVSTSE